MAEKRYLEAFRETISAYYPISDESFSMVENILRFQTLNKDQLLLNIGEIARHIHFICEGAVIAYFTDCHGNTYNKNIFLENQIAGSTVSALLKTPSQFTLQAIEETILISINYQQYKELIYKCDELKNFYIAYLERNWVIEKEQREISLVMETATARYLKLLSTYPEIVQRIPLQHIASHLGVTPTQLSRIRKDLKAK